VSIPYYRTMIVELSKDGIVQTVVIVGTTNANFARETAEFENPGWTAGWVGPGVVACR